MKYRTTDVFDPPYSEWEGWKDVYLDAMRRGLRDNARPEECWMISDPKSAAIYMAQRGADNALERHIDRALDDSDAYAELRRAMPSVTPAALSKYQREYPNFDRAAVKDALTAYGVCLEDGQALFHAGLWPGGGEFVSDRPFSTSYCPQIALRNADHNAKAYIAVCIDLMVVRTVDARTSCFAFRRRGTSKGHEKEVLFNEGARLTLRSRQCVREGYPVGRYEHPHRQVPVFVLEVDLS